jgi:TolB-like protein
MNRLPPRFQLDLAAYRLLRDGRPVRLERQPMELLILLASRPETLVTREEIAAQFWGDGVFVDVDGSINRIVAKLRAALDDDPAKPRFIETVVGKGYRLTTRLDPPIRSIAVLPFRNPGQSTDDHELADSITGSLISQLDSIPSLRVVPRRSVDRFASTTQPLHEVARELKVDAIVEGQVAADGPNVHVTAKLLHPTTEKQLWAATYQRHRGSAAAVPGEVTQAIAEQLQVRLAPKAHGTTPDDRELRAIPAAARPDDVAHADLTTPAAGLDLNLGTHASLVGKRSVAVLPFKLLTLSGEDAFLSIALADAIITHLSASQDLLVRPIGMVQRYAREAPDPLTAARELNVQVVVSGTVQRVGPKLRVCLQAVDATNGSVLLSAKHDAELIDLFALQDAIAERVANALELERHGENESGERRPTGNRMAYELFLRSADKLSRLNQWDTRAAIEMLGKAVQLDREFAGAWARLAEAHLLMAFTFGQGARGVGAAERAARRAVALDPSNSVAQCSRGLVLWSPARGFQNSPALRALSIALKLNPANLTARLWRCLIFLHVGLFDAAEEGLKIAFAVRPDDPNTVLFLGHSAMYRHHYDEADAYYARALTIDAANIWTNVFYPVIPLYRGALDDAERKIAAARELQGNDPWLTSCEALLWAKRGEAAKAERLLPTALRGKPLFHTHHMWHTAAATYATLGQHQRALSLLERAAAFGLPNFTLFRDDPHFHPLRSLRGFQKLLARLQRERRALEADVQDAC